MKCYLSRNYKGVSSSGYKAKTDMEDLMAGWGFRNIGLKRTFYPHVIVSFVLTLFGVLKALVCLRKGDILFLQYPLKKYFSFICNVAHFKGCKIVILIHDLGSFRRKKLSVSQEIKRLEHADYIIATNPAMQQWIKDRHCQIPVGHLGVWDYLSVARPDAHKELPSPPLPDCICRSTQPTKKCLPLLMGRKDRRILRKLVWQRILPGRGKRQGAFSHKRVRTVRHANRIRRRGFRPCMGRRFRRNLLWRLRRVPPVQHSAQDLTIHSLRTARHYLGASCLGTFRAKQPLGIMYRQTGRPEPITPFNYCRRIPRDEKQCIENE